MSISDSMFLIEFIVEELKSFIDCKSFCIQTQFADVFTVQLRDPNVFKGLGKIKGKRKQKIPNVRLKRRKSSSESESKVEAGQSILLASDVKSLIENMTLYPMELFLYSYKHPEFKLGSTHIAWNAVYIDYLNKVISKEEPPLVAISADHNVFDEYTSRRMASIKLNIKLSHLRDQITTPMRPISEEYKKAFMYTETEIREDSNIKESQGDTIQEIGTVKTIYNSEKKKSSRTRYRGLKKDSLKSHLGIEETNTEKFETDVNVIKEIRNVVSENVHQSIMSLTRSNTEIDIKKQINVIKSKSYSSFDFKERLEMLRLIFGDPSGPHGDKVYYVGYFTVENDTLKNSPPVTFSPQGSPVTPSPKHSSKMSVQVTTDQDPQSSEKISTPAPKYKFKLCENECQQENEAGGICQQSIASLDLPEEASHLISVRKCKLIECNHKQFLKPLPPPDDRMVMEFKGLSECCKVEKIEEVIGGLTANMKIGDDPCYCACECRFGFFKKTTYCKVCGGYEIVGEEITQKAGMPPYPCPIYHKLVDKNKLKTSSGGSDTKRKITAVTAASDAGVGGSAAAGGGGGGVGGVRSEGTDASKNLAKRPATGSDKKSVESEKDSNKKVKKIIKDDRFKFNYGYQGIPPQIGHSQCAMPCTGTLGQVPKRMGWLWTAENVPGMKFRPNWRPGATNKHVVRLLKIARYPEQAIAKRRKKDSGKQKRPLKRPLLVVQKKEGEYSVTMETMKIFNKYRPPNQYPYEDKPLVTYTIGRTEEENFIRKKKKERAARRLEREQRDFIQSAFRDMCKEICIKTYQQALGLLPDSEDPECACYPAEPGPDRTNLEHSCSCSDSLSSFGSDTDDDEWIVEFTPPNAFFDPAYKGKKIHQTDNTTQYTYLDYRVKLLDRYGNPVPRFFTGPDGKRQCSDLGGFWSPDHKWLEINIDGFIAPDGRWAPNNFIGPSGEQVDTDTGKFQTTNGTWLVIGVDGYIDCQTKWRYYPMRKQPDQKKRPAVKKGPAGDKKDGGKEPPRTSEATWSCFGDTSPKHLADMGIVGHGHDRKLLLSTLEQLLAQGEDVKIPQPSTVPRSARKKGKKPRAGPSHLDARSHYMERFKCRHAVPSSKGIVAVNEFGHKTYFKLIDYKNPRPKERLVTLGGHGISLSSFHVPCLSSFISTELMKQQQYEHILEHNARYQKTKNVAAG